ncbi:hypothetical protein Z043_101477 [Scleropages formosus]|uniref:Acid-sensing ion channel 1-like n=1 Tax=Scleropages formosus TaxID=113540 RepID=A0A0P7VY44_SCLFO|nr:hypothetical protein Z043_101477 [Scleropages formosus]
MDLKVESEEVDCKQPVPIEVFASRSTLHGISHMFSYQRICIKRCLWILFFMGSLSFLIYVCVDRIQFYFEYPHVTKLDEVLISAMIFPSVTFCNLNAFRFSRVTRNDLYHAGELLALLNGRCVCVCVCVTGHTRHPRQLFGGVPILTPSIESRFEMLQDCVSQRF